MLAVLALFALAACDVNDMVLTPRDGDIASGSTVTVTGQLSYAAAEGGTLTVNGVPGTFTGARTWQATIPTSPVGYVTIVNVRYVEPGGTVYTQQTAVINGPKISDGEYSPNGVGMKFTNAGLSNLGPVINNLAGASFDISGLILAQDPLVPSSDVGLGHSISGKAYEAGAESITIGATSTSTGVSTPITVSNLYLGLDLNISGPILSGPCKLEARVPTTAIDAKFDLKPGGPNGEDIDVNMVGSPTVNLQGVNYEFISGICDPSTFLIGSIINSVAGGQVESAIRNGFASQLGDPDGSGPADSPIADAIETALAQVSIAGPVGEAVKANLKAPFTQINETSSGIDFRSNADFYTTFGNGPTDCVKIPRAPDFTSSYDVPGVYPTLGGTAPNGQSYGLGLVISTSAFNQLLSSMTECGLLTQDLTAINGVPITPSFLALLVPQFANLDPGAQVFIRLDPRAAPFISPSASGPSGTAAELRLEELHVDFMEVLAGGQEHKLLGLSVEAPLGLDLNYDSVAGTLAPTITPPVASDVNTRVYFNGLNVNPTTTAALFSSLFPALSGGLTDTFEAFPLPEFLGLKLSVVQVVRQGNSFVLYANLDQIKQTRIENVQLTDLSTGDSSDDATVFDSNEWRHRIRKKVDSKSVRVDYKAVIGADACCFADDEEKTAHAGYRLTFNVIPEGGQTWHLNLAQLIAGAHTIVDDGGGTGRTSISTITGQAKIGSGAWNTFNITPSSSGVNTGSNNSTGFSGGNSKVLSGTTAQTITVEFGFDVLARSESTVFPPVAGDEAAIRIGANDSLANGFTAGGYPGLGNRNLLNDGHVFTLSLTAS
ncbi:MAG: hypothetical protein KF703_03650 [Actinobacteria bacterium]|nr:hypothetical protein [Actinomycetota bacterium]